MGVYRGVIDVGSNSVRLVVYDGPARAPIVICNEKVLCGLGRSLAETGAIDAEAMDSGIETLHRFRGVTDAIGDVAIRAVATAAVRDATNGPQFVKAAAGLGFEIEVLSGAEEAVYAALGVVSAEPRAKGLVGDLGGGSLEVIETDGPGVVEADNQSEAFGRRSSLSLGALRLLKESEGRLDRAGDLIRKRLAKADWLGETSADDLYVVGGAWRAIARIQMAKRGYPLSILHHFTMSRAEALAICDWVATVKDTRSLENIPGVPRRRLDTLPFAALVLKHLLQKTSLKRVVVSSAGVREGLLFEQLAPAARMGNPLIEGCDHWAERLSPAPEFGHAAEKLTAALYPDETPVARRLRQAACRLSDIGALFHPDHRANQAFSTILHAPFVAVDHEARIFLALSLFRRYAGRGRTPPNKDVVALIGEEAQAEATKLGLALRFAGEFAPKARAALTDCTWKVEGEDMIFEAPVWLSHLVSEVVRKRLASAAEAFEKNLVLRV